MCALLWIGEGFLFDHQFLGEFRAINNAASSETPTEPVCETALEAINEECGAVGRIVLFDLPFFKTIDI